MIGDQGEFGPALERDGTLEMAVRMAELTGCRANCQSQPKIAHFCQSKIAHFGLGFVPPDAVLGVSDLM